MTRPAQCGMPFFGLFCTREPGHAGGHVHSSDKAAPATTVEAASAGDDCETNLDGIPCGLPVLVDVSTICPHEHIERVRICGACAIALWDGYASCSLCFAVGVLAMVEPIDFRSLVKAAST